MKIKVWCDSGVDIYSCREEVIDIEEEWGLSTEEWEEMSEKAKEDVVRECLEWRSLFQDIEEGD